LDLLLSGCWVEGRETGYERPAELFNVFMTYSFDLHKEVTAGNIVINNQSRTMSVQQDWRGHSSGGASECAREGGRGGQEEQGAPQGQDPGLYDDHLLFHQKAPRRCAGRSLCRRCLRREPDRFWCRRVVVVDSDGEGQPDNHMTGNNTPPTASKMSSGKKCKEQASSSGKKRKEDDRF
jgi:hypothetical protein